VSQYVHNVHIVILFQQIFLCNFEEGQGIPEQDLKNQTGLINFCLNNKMNLLNSIFLLPCYPQIKMNPKYANMFSLEWSQQICKETN